MTMTRDEAVELLAEIHQKCDNLLAAATLPMPANIHAEGMKGGLDEIRSLTESAYEEAT